VYNHQYVLTVFLKRRKAGRRIVMRKQVMTGILVLLALLVFPAMLIFANGDYTVSPENLSTPSVPTPETIATPNPHPISPPEPPDGSPVLDISYDNGKQGSRFVLRTTLFDDLTGVHVLIKVLINEQNVANISLDCDNPTIVLRTVQSAQDGKYQVSLVGLASGYTLATTQYTLDANAPLREDLPAKVVLVDVPAHIAPVQEQQRFSLYFPLVVR
jgi:hypothetical protein